MKIKNIEIESEIKGQIVGGDTENDNSDIFVELENNDRYVATFFTYKNIDFLRKKNKKTGENLNGKYFFATNMLIVDSLERKDIEKVIKDLLKTEDFYYVFQKICPY